METIQTSRQAREHGDRQGDVTVGRFVIPYRVYGDGEAYIICVNGAQQTIASWRAFISYFSRSFKIVVFDFPGQGRARILSGSEAVEIDEQVEIVRAVSTAAVPRDTFHLFGASWGGIIAMSYAARYPERVDKLILASLGLTPNAKMVEIIKTGQRYFDEGVGFRIGHMINETFGIHLPEPFKKKIVQQFEAMTREQFLSFYAHSDFVHRITDVRNMIDLRKIRADTFIINGEDDPILNLEDVSSTAALIPRCRTQVISGAGHFLHLERESIYDIYSSFLTE